MNEKVENANSKTQHGDAEKMMNDYFKVRDQHNEYR